MADTDFEHVVDLYEYIDPSDIVVAVDQECVCLLQAAEGRHEAIVDALREGGHPQMTVYSKVNCVSSRKLP